MGQEERGSISPHSLPPTGTRHASCEFTLQGRSSHRVINVETKAPRYVVCPRTRHREAAPTFSSS